MPRFAAFLLRLAKKALMLNSRQRDGLLFLAFFSALVFEHTVCCPYLKAFALSVGALAGAVALSDIILRIKD